MKKIILSIASATIVALAANAQVANLLIKDFNGLSVKSTTIDAYTGPNNSVEIVLKTVNPGNINENIIVKKVLINTISNTENYFCWDVCLGVNALIAGNVTHEPNVEKTAFITHFDPKGQASGTSTIRYVFYSPLNPLDSSFVTINYNIIATGIADDNSIFTNEISVAKPSPASFNTLINYSVTSTINAKIQLSNVLGANVAEFVLDNNKGAVSIPVSDLENGIYFYSLVVNNKLMATKKLIIAN